MNVIWLTYINYSIQCDTTLYCNKMFCKLYPYLYFYVDMYYVHYTNCIFHLDTISIDLTQTLICLYSVFIISVAWKSYGILSCWFFIISLQDLKTLVIYLHLGVWNLSILFIVRTHSLTLLSLLDDKTHYTAISPAVCVCLSVCLSASCTPQFWSHNLIDPHLGT